VNWFSVQPRSLSALRGKHLIARRVVKNANFKLLVFSHQRNRDAEHGIAMREVRRAIQRIDVPAIVGAGIAARAFFAH